MHLKAILSKSLKWFANHLFGSILGLVLAAMFATWGTFFSSSAKRVLTYVIQLLSTPSPLWITILLILLCGLYNYLRLRQHQHSYKTPNIQEELHEAFGVYWNTQYKLRCLRCKWPLKCASKLFDSSVFFCSNCDTKYALRDQNGNHLTEVQAIEQLKKLPTSQ
jgi:hypothetical protein